LEAISFSASDLVRLDESLDVARNKPDEFAEPHEWDRSRLYAVIQGSQGYVESFSRLYFVQQAVAGIVLHCHAMCGMSTSRLYILPFHGWTSRAFGW
jgi:hypothetical protein